MESVVSDNSVKFRDPLATNGIFSRFPSFDKCRSEAASDVISGVAVDSVGMDVRAISGEPGLNSSRIILLSGRPDPFYASLVFSI